MTTHTPDDAPAAVTSSPRRRTVRLLLLIGVAAVAVVGAIMAVAANRTVPAQTGGATSDGPPRLAAGGSAVGAALPSATLAPLGELGPPGGLVLPSTDGRPMIVNFWASWCAPCVNEMPMLQRIADELGITVVGIDYVDRDDKAVALAAELGITYPLVLDDQGEYGQRIGLIGTPTTLLVDGDGIVRRQLTGELTEAELRREVEASLS